MLESIVPEFLIRCMEFSSLRRKDNNELLHDTLYKTCAMWERIPVQIKHR